MGLNHGIVTALIDAVVQACVLAVIVILFAWCIAGLMFS